MADLDPIPGSSFNFETSPEIILSLNSSGDIDESKLGRKEILNKYLSNIDDKVLTIEDIDSKVIGPLLEKTAAYKNFK